MDSIKINGGSFRLSAVLAYKTEAAFVKHYKKLFAGWLTDDKRELVLKETYRIARELKKQENGNSKRGVEKNSGIRYTPDSEATNRKTESDTGFEPGADDAREEC